MIQKNCPNHPQLSPLILESQNQTHTAYARCPECDRFLGWVGRRDLAAHIDDLESEAARLKSVLEAPRTGEVLPWDLT